MANNKTRWDKENPPNTLLAIDPGASYPRSKVPYAGACLFQWGFAVWAGLVKCPTTVPPFARPNALVRAVCEAAGVPRHGDVITPHRGPGQARPKRWHEKVDDGEGIVTLVVEQPVLYKRGASRPQDIMALRSIYGAFMGGIDAEFYSGPTPGEWKGSIDGVIFNERVLTVANSAERLLLMEAQARGDGGLSDHVIDAMGLGMFTLGRIGVGGVV